MIQAEITTDESVTESVHIETIRRNFIRAAIIAQQLQYPNNEIRHLQELALKQMACEYRNAVATHRLVKEWGLSRTEVERLFQEALKEHENRPNKIRSDTCYDVATGKYLTLQEWIERFLSTSKL